MTDKPTIQDPNVEPPGYKPPTSAKELLERYARGERCFFGAQLQEAELPGAILEGVLLAGARMRGANLAGANLRHANFKFSDVRLGGTPSVFVVAEEADLRDIGLQGADLTSALMAEVNMTGANLNGATMVGTDLTAANMEGTRLVGANMSQASLRGACLRGATLGGTVLNGTLLDYLTCAASGIDSDILKELFAMGATISKLSYIDDDILKAHFSRNSDGLTLYFSTRPTPFDRFLVDGVIFGVLGKDTDVHVAEYQERGETAIVRLEGKNRTDLEAVADALWERIWEQQEKAHGTAVMTLAKDIVLQLTPALSTLRDRLDRIELRLPDEEAVEMLNDKGAEHVKTKDLKVVRTWGQKALTAVGKRIVKELTDEGVEAVTDVVKGVLPKGRDDEEER